MIKRSMHRLEHTDLIRTVREDMDTPQQKYKIDKERKNYEPSTGKRLKEGKNFKHQE